MDYVYFIGHSDRDDTLIKIGRSYDIARRIDQLQASVPFRLICINYVECDGNDAEKVEKAIHRHLKDRRVHREWFDIRRHEIIPAVKAALAELGSEIVSVDGEEGEIPPPGRPPYTTEPLLSSPTDRA